MDMALKFNSETSIFLFTTDITLDGGVERVVANMANEFIKYYTNIHIVSNFKKNITIKYEIDSRINIHYLHSDISYEQWMSSKPLFSFFKKGMSLKWVRSLGLTSKLYYYIESVTSEKSVLMFHGYGFLAWKKHKNVKTIGVDHSAFPYAKLDYSKLLNKIRLKIATYMSRKLDIVTCLTDAELNYWKVIGRPTYIMPNFIPDVPQNIRSFEERKKIVLSMGRMNTDQKGFDRLIAAYAKIANKYPDWQLHIYGSGELQVVYKEMIEKFNVVDYVKIYDFTSNPYEKYQESLIYALCSRSEGFPMVLLESMINMVVPISYENAGSHTIIIENENGYLVENGDERNLINRLEFLMNNPQTLSNMSLSARKSIINRYSAQVIVPQWVRLFTQLTQ